MNPIFEQYPQVRRHLYLAQFIIAGVILLLGVGFASAGMDFPTWYVVASAVASAGWSYLGLQAASNTQPRMAPRDEGGYFRITSSTWPASTDARSRGGMIGTMTDPYRKGESTTPDPAP